MLKITYAYFIFIKTLSQAKWKREQEPQLADILILVNGSEPDDSDEDEKVSSLSESRPGSRAWREAMKARWGQM